MRSLTLGLLSALLFLCASAERRESATESVREPERFRILVTGPTAAALEPCGCSGGMKGGLARRPAVLDLAASETPGSIILDCGDVVAPPEGLPALPERPAYEEIVFDLTAQALAQMNYGAVALGERDLVLAARPGSGTGLGLYSELLFGGAPVLTNVHANVDECLRASARIESEGRSVLFLCVVDGARPTWSSDYRYEDPAAALRRVLAAENSTPRDFTILVYHGVEETAMRALVRSFEQELDLVLDADGALEPDEVRNVRREGSTIIVRPGQRGRYVLDLSITKDAVLGTQLVALEALPVEESWPESDSLKDLVERYRERTRTSEPPLATSYAGLALPDAGQLYSGSGSCAPCHPKAFEIWKASGHGHAMETLEEKGAMHAPDCVRCHVVGFGFVSGYFDPRLAEAGLQERLTDLRGVGCEECHGPGLRHVLAPRRNHLVTHPRTSPKSCTRCHDTENSPRFLVEEEAYWKKIAHDKE